MSALPPNARPIVCASELPLCECCDEPWCPQCQTHYVDCACLGPHNAEEEGYAVEEINGRLWGIPLASGAKGTSPASVGGRIAK